MRLLRSKCVTLRECRPAPATAGGLPIGAVLVKQHVADAMAPGDHGSTFAGNPLVCHAAVSVVDIISDPAFLAGAPPPPTHTRTLAHTHIAQKVLKNKAQARSNQRLPFPRLPVDPVGIRHMTVVGNFFHIFAY